MQPTDITPPLVLTILAHARAGADRSALQILRPTGAERWSYDRLGQTILRARDGIAAIAAPGARVRIATANTPDTATGFLGAVLAGCLPVLSDPADAEFTTRSLTDTPAIWPDLPTITPPAQTPRILWQGAFDDPDTLLRGLFHPWHTGATALIPAPGVPGAALPLLAKRFDATVLCAEPETLAEIAAAHPGLSLPKLTRASTIRPGPAGLGAHWHAATGIALDAPDPDPEWSLS